MPTVGLAVEMMRSLGLRGVDDFPREAIDRSLTHWLSDEFASFGEPEVAGWLLTPARPHTPWTVPSPTFSPPIVLAPSR